MYLDFSKNYLVAGPIIDIKSRSDLTRQSVEAATTVDVTRLPLQSAVVLGNAKGKDVLYVFSGVAAFYLSSMGR